MASTNQTVETAASVSNFIKKVKSKTRRDDSVELVRIFTEQTRLPAKMWGPAIIGFGSYHYVYDSGREGDAPLVAFSPRATSLVLYLSIDFPGREALLEKLGKHKTGKSCIYINTLEDVDKNVLAKMVKASFTQSTKRYGV